VILWESKRTKGWNEEWLAKLRDDKRAATAAAGSRLVPPGIANSEPPGPRSVPSRSV